MSEILEKLEKELTCNICLDIYENPKLLQCFHTYCQNCLRRLPRRNEEEKLVLPCPECRHETLIPEDGAGVADLKSAFHINRLLDFMKQQKDESANDAPASSTPHCSEHANEELKLYCETCEKIICFQCAVKDLGEHHGHGTILLDVAFEKYKEEISSSLEQLDNQLGSINHALEQINACRAKVMEQHITIQDDISRQLQDVRETQLKTQLDQITTNKMEKLARQEEQLKNQLVQLEPCRYFLKENMKMDSYHDALEMKTSAIKQTKRLINSFPYELLKPCTESDIQYSDLFFKGELHALMLMQTCM